MVAEATGEPRRVAFFGLGQMGLPMAGRLLAAGHDVLGVDPSAAAREAFTALGGRALPALEAADGAEIVITMLPDGKIVQRALLQGDPAVVGRLAAGSIVVDMSSSFPGDTLDLGKALRAQNVGLVDAPVSGGVKKARDGTLTIMLGGSDELVASVRPLMAAMGKAVFAAGGLGSGHAMKALNNYVSAAGLAAAAEALLVGRKFGLDPDVMVDILNVSTGRNNSTEVKMKPFVLSGSFDSGFALALMAKDLGTAHDLALMLEVETPLADCTTALWARAAAALGPGADHTEIFRYLEDLRRAARS
jgi:3-hydroxyisobutyrate dehydrogenase